MPFRGLYYFWKFYPLLLFVIGAFLIFSRDPARSAWAYAFAVHVGIALVAGLWVFLGKPRTKCPFCGERGEAAMGKSLWMECPRCGVVSGTGPFGLRIGREPEE